MHAAPGMLPPPGMIEKMMSIPEEHLPEGGMMAMMMNAAKSASNI